MAEATITPRERRGAQRKARQTTDQKRRREAQEAENAQMVVKGTRSIAAAEQELRRSLKRFGAVRTPRGSPERRELGFLVRNVEDALRALRRAKRGSLIEFSDPDLAIDDPDLEG